ncbi:MAG TPA: hypothetical protein DEH25_01855 [Chloroflexi bacterium]|nr:hypothetical protein [Chloroflexota bacterium]HBY08293.1 hypothetical protein [Chloroflexota bacterium]
MYKLIILIPPVAEGLALDEGWPEFLHNAERMPGLLREASIRVTAQLFGDHPVSTLHELFFADQTALQAAMSSPEGLAAGQILQQITRGQMTLLIAEHREDEAENLRQYRQDE